MAFSRMPFMNPQYVSYPAYPYHFSDRRVNSACGGFQQYNQYEMARQGAVSLEEIIKNKVANFRRWKQMKICKKHTQSRWAFNFSVMTYNILSQTAAENHRYLYKHCNLSFMQEDYRISRILPEILNSRSDVICLQEVEQHLYDNQIKRFFDTRGFESIFKKRTGNKNDGCAILWRRQKFNLLTHLDVEFRKQGNGHLNRDNVGLIAVLKPNHPDSRNTQINVATTHLIYNPKRGEVKLCQLRLLLAELERLALKEVNDEERLYHPTILCGDFNIEPHSPLYEFIESGSIDIVDMLSGDMSGQSVGGSKGKYMTHQKMSLDRIGINKSSRYEEIPEDCSMDVESTLNSVVQQISDNLPNIKSNDSNLMEAIGTSSGPGWFQYREEQCVSQPNQIKNVGTEPKQIVYQDSDGVNSSSTQDVFSHEFKFVPVYKFHHVTKKDMFVTSMTGKDFNTVDHIFYNVRRKQSPTSFLEGRLKLLGYYSLLKKEEIAEIDGLPNAHLGSDHISLIAQFGMRFRR